MLNRRIARTKVSPLQAMGAFALLAGLLYFGAGIIVPLVLAILIAFALTPLVNWLNRKLRLPDPVAVILSVMVAALLLVMLAGIAGVQLARLAQELPRYQEVVSTKLEAVQDQFGGGAVLERVNAIVEAFGQRLAEAGPDGAVAGRPVPVVISNESAPLGLLTSVLGSIIGPVATVAIVVVFLVFLLMGRADLLDRFIRLVGSRDYARANIALADASKRVGRYLLVQLAVNCTYGLIFGLGLWLIGVPSAVLWGLLIVVFRYIPFIGALIIAVVPFGLAFAVDPGWNMLILSVGLFLVLDLTTANVIEPRLYGSSTGVSPIAILLSAMFWATLWGPIGLILSTPMTVCLVVIGRHLPQFRFLDTLLGSEPVLTAPEQLYQRLLKGDTQGAIDSVESFLEEHDKRAFIEEVALPMLRMASVELTDRPEAMEQRRQLASSFDMVLEEIGEVEPSEDAPVLLVGGRTEFDEAAARLIAMLAAMDGTPTRVLPPLAIRPEAISRLDLDGVVAVALVFLGSDIRAHARYVSRRFSRKAAHVRLVACALGPTMPDETAEKLHLHAVYRLPAETVSYLEESAPQTTTPGASHAAPVVRSAVLDDPKLVEMLRAIADQFDVPVATVNFVGDERAARDKDAYRLTELVATTGKSLVITAEAEDEDLRNNAYLQSNGIRLYASVPLALRSGEVVGTLTLLDYEEHEFGSSSLDTLEARAGDVSALLSDRP